MRAITVVGVVVMTGLLSLGVAWADTAGAVLRNAEGQAVGEAILTQERDGVRIAATFTGLPPGTRAFHIHEVGRCEPPFESAGAHFNPTGKQHGMLNPKGPHAGDLPNIEVRAGGPTKVETVARGVSLDGRHGLLEGDGTSLVVHEGADDHRTDPAGESGKRIACGVITRR